MKYGFPLVFISLLAACEPIETEKATPSVVEGDLCVDEGQCDLGEFEDASFPDINVTVVLDCEQVGAFRKDDICVSNCTLCSSQEICIDTNGDKFNDTCMQGETPVTPPPAREPPPAVEAKKVPCGGIEVELGVPCSGAFGACAENGKLECFDGKLTCSTDVKGSESLATEEVCGDNIDNNCNGIVDDTCSKPIDLSEEDKDGDGFKSLVDCDDDHAGIYPGVNCPKLEGLTKDSYKLVYTFLKVPESTIVEYKATLFYFKRATSAYEITGKLTDSFKFNAKTESAVVDLELTDMYVRFNTIDAPGWWSTCGGAFAYGEQAFALNPNIKVYLVKSGTWTDVTSKVYALGSQGDEMSDSQNTCSAVIDL